MKVEIKRVHPVFAWTWDIPSDTTNSRAQENEVDDFDVCGICRANYNRTCPTCKFPGEECPLVVGVCNHNFHVHCIYKWLDTTTSRGLCPMCRQPFQLRKDVAINKSQFEKFSQLAWQRQQELHDLEDGLAEDEALARAIAEQTEAIRADNQGDIMMDPNMSVR